MLLLVIKQQDFPHNSLFSCLSCRGVSGCNSSTIGPYPSIFATMQGNCSDDESEDDDNPERVFEAEIELVSTYKN